ncbi:MAG: hypothetical protein RI885_2467 [Actinomycetota bacterium]|jgi:predicted acetyltransferase
MVDDYQNLPIDARSLDRLAAGSLRLGLVPGDDSEAFAAWLRAESRGFHEEEPTREKIDQAFGYSHHKRISAVWDDTAADAATPVATVDSWVADLTVPGGATVPGWAVSAVTVSPTHRRRGIARALLEAELRTAKAAGCALAMLTVSESTIYGHFGFAPAVIVADLEIDTKRASWTGPAASGRVHFVTADDLLVEGLAIVDRVRRATPGELVYSGRLWERQLGRTVGDEEAKHLRFARYDDADGVPQGFAIFRLRENEADFTRHRLAVHTLVAATDEAAAGLWRFLLEHDLVGTVTAGLRPVDDPVRWMIGDFRAVKSTPVDHLWIRILDVKAALEARTYSGPGAVVLKIEDALDLGTTTVTLAVDETGRGSVTSTPDAGSLIELTVDDLAAIYLGGVRASTLARAGRIRGDVSVLDGLFASPVTPVTSIWF